MLRATWTVLCILALSGCAAHEVYEREGLNSVGAPIDWAECQRSALAETGVQTTDDLGRASIRGNRLIGELVADPEMHDVAGYKASDYFRIKRRQELRQECMKAKGYRFLGVPAVERL